MNHSLFPADLLVTVDANGELSTTSLAVAQYFGKSHKNILRDIENLQASIVDLKITDLNDIAAENHYIPDVVGRLRFEPTFFIDKWNRQQPMHRLTRDEFMMLTGRYSGPKATLCQVRFLAAFNTMEALLHATEQRYLDAFDTIRPNLRPTVEGTEAGQTRAEIAAALGKTPASVSYHRRAARRFGLLKSRG